MSDNFPPEATHEQRGMPRSFGTPYGMIPVQVSQEDSDRIARDAKTYGG